MKQLLLTFSIFLFSGGIFAQDLVYKPISPFFGGDTFAYQQILASASAQNDFTEDSASREQGSDLDNFTESLNRRMLSALSQSLFQQQLGDADLTVGTYSFGDLLVEITPGAGGLNVSILNTATGEQTQIIIPDNG